MDQEILIQVRIAYFLGNYGKVLELWQNYDDSKMTDKDYYYFIISRALIASRELKPRTVTLTKEPSKKLLEITELVNRWIGPMLKPQRTNTTIDEDRKIMEDVLKKAKEQQNQQNHKVLQLICAYLSVNSCEAQYALTLDLQVKDAFYQELLFLQLLVYLRGRRFDLAEQTLLELKKYDDEDILTYLGQIYQNVYSGQPEQAVKCITETKERFGESAKLMNLMISSLINLNKFEDAYEFGNKLQTALVEKEQFSDRVEIETCLSNLIVLAEICGKSSQKDEYIKALQSVNPSAQFLKRLADKMSKLDRLQ